MATIISMVLFFVLIGIVAAMACPLFLLIAFLIVPKESKARIRAIVISGLFPFAVGIYYIFAFFVYAGVGDMVGRPADYGEYWAVSLGNGYLMEMNDSPETASIVKSNISIVWDITRVSQVGTILVGEKGEKPVQHFFLLDTATNHLTIFPDEATLRTASKKIGVTSFTLASNKDFYYQHRVGSFEWGSLAISTVIPIAGLWWLISYFVKLRRRARLARSSTGVTKQ